MSDTLPRRGQSARYARIRNFVTGTDVISASCAREFASLRPAGCTTSRANATMCAPHVHTQNTPRLYTRASYQRRASRRRNKFEFPMPPVKFPYQYPDYICITVHGRPATRDGDTTSALVKMRESARYSLLSSE